jgi:hypothetical protein
MFVSFQEAFNPTSEQRKKQYDFLNKLIQANLDKKGPDCINCKYQKGVQESPYYDYTTCKFDNSVELPGGLDYRHCCSKYEFIGFLEV